MNRSEAFAISFMPARKSPKKVILLLLLVLLIISLSAAAFMLGIYATAEKMRSDAAAASTALAKEKSTAATDIDLATALRTSTVNDVIAQESFPAYSLAQIQQLDVSQPSGANLSDLKLVTQGALVGLEESFLKAEQDYGVNCLFVMSIASIESANGTICYRPNNMFGYGGISFSSKAECINVVSQGLATKYLKPGSSLYSGKTISDVNKRYAASTTWDDKVAKKMASYYAIISKHHNAALEKLK